MPRRFVRFAGGVKGVAVLYSVVNAGMREFWVKTATADVKAYEIPTTFTYTPSTSFGSTVGSTISGSLTLSSSESSAGVDLAFLSIRHGSISFLVETTATYISGSGASIEARPVTTEASSTVSQSVTSESGSASTTVSSTAQNGGCLPIGLSLIKSNPLGSISASGTVTYTITAISSGTVSNPFECWISSPGGGAIYLIIKSGVNTSGCSEGENPIQDFTDLALINLPSLSTAEYSNGDSVTTRPGHWREPLEDFLYINDQPPSGSSCADDYLPDRDSLISAGNLYEISLDQTISGQTLRDRLQTSTDTVAATLTTQTATDGVTCTLGTATESTVQVPSPGRGTIEGLTYLL